MSDSKFTEQYGTRFRKRTAERLEELQEKNDWNDSEVVRHLVEKGLEQEESSFYKDEKIIALGALLAVFCVFGLAFTFILILIPRQIWALQARSLSLWTSVALACIGFVGIGFLLLYVFLKSIDVI